MVPRETGNKAFANFGIAKDKQSGLLFFILANSDLPGIKFFLCCICIIM